MRLSSMATVLSRALKLPGKACVPPGGRDRPGRAGVSRVRLRVATAVRGEARPALRPLKAARWGPAACARVPRRREGGREGCRGRGSASGGSGGAVCGGRGGLGLAAALGGREEAPGAVGRAEAGRGGWEAAGTAARKRRSLSGPLPPGFGLKSRARGSVSAAAVTQVNVYGPAYRLCVPFSRGSSAR